MVWDSKIKFVNSCGRIEGKFIVYFDQIVYHKIKYLMGKFDRLEWLGYLIGTIHYEEKKAYVNDFMIPKQVVNSVNVKDIVSPIGKQYVGVIHSHHHMMNSFSGTDHEFINQNNDISILVTHKEINGQIRMKTECGCFYVVPIEIMPNFENILDEEFIKSVDENIVIEGHSTLQEVSKKIDDVFNLRNVFRERIKENNIFSNEINHSMYDEIKRSKTDNIWDDVYDEEYDEEDEDGLDRGYIVHNGVKYYAEEEEEEIVVKKHWTT